MITKEIIQNKRVLLRADLDLPLQEGSVTDTFRLEAILPTIKFCLEHAQKTVIIGHLGRPNGADQAFSLAPVRESLNSLLNQSIPLTPSGIPLGESWKGESPLVLLENLRFDSREENNDRELAIEISSGADIYIYEAFAAYHACASLNQIPEVLPTITGFRFDEEVSTLQKVLHNPLRPSLLLASGAKADKLAIISQVSPRFDTVLLGGQFAKLEARTADGLDLNQETTSLFIKEVAKAKTVVLNGPLGKFEDNVHSEATRAIFQAIADSKSYSVIGGGDTLSALSALGFSHDQFSFISTGGGAMLEFLARGTHPVLEVIKNAKLK